MSIKAPGFNLQALRGRRSSRENFPWAKSTDDSLNQILQASRDKPCLHLSRLTDLKKKNAKVQNMYRLKNRKTTSGFMKKTDMNWFIPVASRLLTEDLYRTKHDFYNFKDLRAKKSLAHENNI